MCVMMMTSIPRQDVGGGLFIGPSRGMLFALDNVGAEGSPLRYPSSLKRGLMNVMSWPLI